MKRAIYIGNPPGKPGDKNHFWHYIYSFGMTGWCGSEGNFFPDDMSLPAVWIKPAFIYFPRG
jgi:hypothetical protein